MPELQKSVGFSRFHAVGHRLHYGAAFYLLRVKGSGEALLVALKHERRVFLLTVRSASYPHTVEPIGFDKTFEIIHDLYKSNKAIVLLNESGVLPDDDDDSAADEPENQDESLVEGTDPRNAVYISDMDIDPKKKLVRILIIRGDPELTNPAFMNSVTRQIRVEPAKADEAPGYSAHLLISYGTSHLADGKARAVLEKMPTVSRSIVFPLLNRLLKKHAANNPEFEYETKPRGRSKSKEIKPYRPRIQVTGKKSSTLKQDLEAGYVTSVDLIDRKAAFGGYDTDNKVREMTRKLEFKLHAHATEKSPDKTGIFGFIKKLAVRGKKDNFDEVQVHVRGLPGNASASPRFSVDVADAADFLYIRTERISGFSKELEQICAKIDPEISAKMSTLLSKQALWAK